MLFHISRNFDCQRIVKLLMAKYLYLFFIYSETENYAGKTSAKVKDLEVRINNKCFYKHV